MSPVAFEIIDTPTLTAVGGPPAIPGGSPVPVQPTFAPGDRVEAIVTVEWSPPGSAPPIPADIKRALDADARIRVNQVEWRVVMLDIATGVLQIDFTVVPVATVAVVSIPSIILGGLAALGLAVIHSSFKRLLGMNGVQSGSGFTGLLIALIISGILVTTLTGRR